MSNVAKSQIQGIIALLFFGLICAISLMLTYGIIWMTFDYVIALAFLGFFLPTASSILLWLYKSNGTTNGTTTTSNPPMDKPSTEKLVSAIDKYAEFMGFLMTKLKSEFESEPPPPTNLPITLDKQIHCCHLSPKMGLICILLKSHNGDHTDGSVSWSKELN